MTFMQTVTQKTLGPTFGDELITAGLANGISWDASGNIYGADTLTTTEQTALQTVYQNHNATALSKSALQTQLAALDGYIPRGLEDYWAATGFDTTKLPTVQQQRLAQKQTLRQQIQTAG